MDVELIFDSTEHEFCLNIATLVNFAWRGGTKCSGIIPYSHPTQRPSIDDDVDANAHRFEAQNRFSPRRAHATQEDQVGPVRVHGAPHPHPCRTRRLNRFDPPTRVWFMRAPPVSQSHQGPTQATEPTSPPPSGSRRAPFVRALPRSPAMAMAMAPAVVSGERLVVFLFVARVALAAPAQLAAPLAVLAAAALAVELAVDGSASASSSPLRRFRTRCDVISSPPLLSVSSSAASPRSWAASSRDLVSSGDCAILIPVFEFQTPRIKCSRSSL